MLYKNNFFKIILLIFLFACVGCTNQDTGIYGTYATLRPGDMGVEYRLLFDQDGTYEEYRNFIFTKSGTYELMNEETQEYRLIDQDDNWYYIFLNKDHSFYFPVDNGSMHAALKMDRVKTYPQKPEKFN